MRQVSCELSYIRILYFTLTFWYRLTRVVPEKGPLNGCVCVCVCVCVVDDSTIWQPGFDLPQCHWTLLNRFQTEQGHCTSCWGLAATVMCPCDKCQIMSHIVNRCPQTKLEGELHSADDDAIEWLETYLAESYRNRNNVALCGMYGLWKTLQFLRVKVSKCTPKQQQQQLLYQSSQSAMPSTIKSLYYSKVSNADRIW